ncbi:MAG: SemiSWEET family sugar transporter [Cytophagaceae bacterium]
MEEGSIWVQVIGYVASAINTAAMIPQVRIIYITQNTRSISLMMFVALLSATGLWITYGIMKKDWPIIAGNTLSLCMSGYIFYKKVLNIKKSRQDDNIENE